MDRTSLRAPAQPGLGVVRRSAIKPQLLNVSTSGTLIQGVTAERNRELGRADRDSAAVKASQHLLVVHAGHPARLEWRHDGRAKAADFADGDAIVNPLGLFIAPRWQSDVELLLIALDPGLVTRVAEELGRQGPVELIPRIHFRDELVRQLAVNLIGEFERDVPPDRVYVGSLAHALVAHLVRHHSVAGLPRLSATRGLPPRVLARVIAYVHEHLSQPVTIETLAREAGLSPSHFVTVFKRSTGLAPHRFVMQQRIERARTLLAETRLPIADVAARTGFADQSHLTRVLRRHTGLTPRLLRGA